jgi:hypothetical protein
MSVCQSFEQAARAKGLIIPDGGSGLQLSTWGPYQHYRELAGIRAARVDALLAGRPWAGRRLDAEVKRLDKSQQTDEGRHRMAESMARVAEWADWIAWKTGRRLDSVVPVASQALTFFYESVYEYAYNDLPAWQGEYLPIDKRPDPAAEQYVWYEMDLAGMPRAVSTYDTTTIPVVAGPAAFANTGKIIPFLVGMEWNFMDERRERMARSQGKPDFKVELNKQKACQRVLAQAVDSLWKYGDALLNMQGLFNHPGVQTITTVGAWAGKQPLQILDDLEFYLNFIPNQTGGQLGDRSKVQIDLPPTQYQLLSRPITAAGDKSILSYFLETHKKVKDSQIRERHDLAAANSQIYYGGPQGLTADTALISYIEGDMDSDPTFVLPQMIEVPAPPRQGGLGEVRFYHVRAGGLRLPDGRRLARVRGL